MARSRGHLPPRLRDKGPDNRVSPLEGLSLRPAKSLRRRAEANSRIERWCGKVCVRLLESICTAKIYSNRTLALSTLKLTVHILTKRALSKCFIDMIMIYTNWATRPIDHPVTWSLDHPVTRSLDHPVTRSLGHPVTRSLDYPVTRSLDHPMTRSLGHPVIWSLGHPVTRSLGHPVPQP